MVSAARYRSVGSLSPEVNMKFIHARRWVVAGAVAATLLAAASGCSASLPGNGECVLTVDNAHASATKSGYIDGKGKVKCVYTQGKLTNLTIETKLQKKSAAGVWTDVRGGSNTTTKATVKSGVTYTGVSGFVRCQKGTFRTGSRAGAYLDGRYSGLSSWEYGRATTNPCP